MNHRYPDSIPASAAAQSQQMATNRHLEPDITPSAHIADRLDDVRRLASSLEQIHGRLTKINHRLFGPMPSALNSAGMGSTPEKVPVEPPMLVQLERALRDTAAYADWLSAEVSRLEAL